MNIFKLQQHETTIQGHFSFGKEADICSYFCFDSVVPAARISRCSNTWMLTDAAWLLWLCFPRRPRDKRAFRNDRRLVRDAEKSKVQVRVSYPSSSSERLHWVPTSWKTAPCDGDAAFLSQHLNRFERPIPETSSERTECTQTDNERVMAAWLIRTRSLPSHCRIIHTFWE